MNKIAVFGFGNVGQQLATLFKDAGYTVMVCSKDGVSGAGQYQHGTFAQGIRQAEAIALAIPYKVAAELLQPLADELAGKIVIDCTNPLNDDWSPLTLGEQTSAAEQISALLPKAKVVKAFNTIFADVMPKSQHDRQGHKITAFIAGDNTEAKQEVQQLAAACSFAPLDCGPLTSARYLEAMAHLNIQIAVGQGGGTKAAFIYHQS